MARASLYRDPDTVRLVTDLDARGLSREAIAERMEISKQTVRKILEPGYAERERQRGKEVDKVRAPLRRRDPNYQEYQARANDSDAHRARVRDAKARRRDQGALDGSTSWAAAAPLARALSDRVTAEERRKAETALVRATVNLSLDASVAANRLIRTTGLAWTDLVNALLIDALERGWTPPTPAPTTS